MAETDYNALLSEAENYVRTYINDHFAPEFSYHNVEHAERVAKAAAEIGNHFQLSDEDYFCVVCAGWFHDLGYYTDREKHEQEGAGIAEVFLKKEGIDNEIIDKIKSCILATKMPQSPKNLLEEILCDADLYHLGTNEFEKMNKRMKKEIESLSGAQKDKKELIGESIKLLENHHYFTDYARLILNDTAHKNLKMLQKKLKATVKEESKRQEAEKILPADSTKTKQAEKKENKKEEKKPSRGIETMFRVSSNNNQRLSRMADNKAHIMITVNSIILSAIISLLLRELDDTSPLRIPTYLILIVCVLTIIFSVLATRPSIPSGKFTQENLDKMNVNLLFFGNFYRMSLDEYTRGMWTLMDSREFLYGSLIRDVYAQGVVLGKKYRYLRISYNIFMFGLILSVIGYIIATMV